ncbi:MAG: carboxymuconolactone decarboxylase family protein [Candidatus Omnitrophica bacterium]|nr:carboxymuconolactone decarboxylase family protein [Candidatus Omnitrophota bacterium]MCA9414743.1 carboxymuconolactone decarboxylase family protein [Candidatus Omnitrophota bacterium]MCA9424576.1 carboxymuconolactone decarboxylase family protein [Candidatus Omnitrophota bacterium]MCA9430781.1 carboxymuconolactone decarboxylase family protein [Candidatus Omnitrophota bacterium]MCA9436161.1 carboxymuconolactone decarboxylase family protein [Candidatus Omnitrophota bacterium]
MTETNGKMVSMALIEEEAKKIYKQYYKVTFKSNALDKKTKELIALGVSAATGCRGCLRGHLRKSIGMGITLDEIKETIAVASGVAAAGVIDAADIANAELGIVLPPKEEEVNV